MVISNEQLLNAVINSVDAAILMVDSNLKVVMCNRRFEDFFGIKQSLILGEDKREAITKYIKWQAKDPEAFQAKLFWLYDNPEKISNDEVEVSVPQRRILHRFSGPVYDQKNILIGRVEVYYDITSSRRLQKESDYKNEQLFLLNAASASVSSSLEIEKMCSLFLKKILEITKASEGALYVLQDKELKKITKIKNECIVSKIRKVNLRKIKNIEWGNLSSSKLFIEKNKVGFYVAFPSWAPNKKINGVCIVVWEELEEKWFNNDLITNIGLYLGIGISNAKLYEEARRSAILQERDRIAMEMHDGLAQTLGYLGLGLDSVFERIKKNKDKNESMELIEQLRTVVDRSYSDVREAIIGLRVNISSERGFYIAVEKYLEEFKNLTKIETVTSIQKNLKEPDFESQLHIIRIIQEATTNVRRHSQATEIKVNISKNRNCFKLLIEDNGKGFVEDENTGGFSSLHQGIKIMYQRAKFLNGELKIISAKGSGTTVSLEIPLKVAGENEKQNTSF